MGWRSPLTAIFRRAERRGGMPYYYEYFVLDRHTGARVPALNEDNARKIARSRNRLFGSRHVPCRRRVTISELENI